MDRRTRRDRICWLAAKPVKQRHLRFLEVFRFSVVTWSDVRFGLERQLSKPEFAIAFASDLLEDDGSDAETLAIASSRRDESIGDAVNALARKEAEDLSALRERWLYLVLAWIFENRYNIDDPLGEVESVYSDLEYPDEISTFVRYMPMVGPISEASNRMRLVSMKAGQPISTRWRNDSCLARRRLSSA